MVCAAATRPRQDGSDFASVSCSADIPMNCSRVVTASSGLPRATRSSTRSANPGGVTAPSGGSYSTSRRMPAVSAVASRVHSAPYEWPRTSTGPPVDSATASTTAATSAASASSV